MAGLRIETVNMGGFRYRNWILSNDEGEIVAYDQDAKFCSRVLGIEPSDFARTYCPNGAPDMDSMQELILKGIEAELDNEGLTVNDLTLY